MARWRSALAALALLGAAAPPVLPQIDAAYLLAREFGNDAPWYAARIPLFQSSDRQLDAVYYYRWRVYRAHQRDLGPRGYITTEFLDDVAWQKSPEASLNDVTPFHVKEGRWLRDPRFATDYLDYMLTGGDDRHFSEPFADTVWQKYLIDGNRAAALAHLSSLKLLYGQWDDRLDRAKGLYWIEPLLDATEYTISSIDASGGTDGFRGGDAFRPSINAYMFANAQALSRLSALAGDAAAAQDFAGKAAETKLRVERDLWNPTLGHFADRYHVSNEHVRYWEPIRGRELVGYVPWAFDLPADDARYAAAWHHLLAPDQLGGSHGLRTVEPTYQYYLRQYRYEGSAPECQWNGPVWPFQTTQALAGMINLLDHYHQDVVTRSDFLRLLRQYAALHYQGDRLDIEEDYHPDTGKPIVGLTRSHHYFHSGFDDLVLTGVVGIRPRADDVLEVNPLIPADGDLAWFRAEHVPYHGHDTAVTWDRDGRRWGRGAGLTVEVDGNAVAHRSALERIEVPLRRGVPAPLARPVDLAVQLERGRFPLPSASSNPDPEALHDAIDGRTMFFPEAPNGWTSGGGGEQWFAIDLGRVTAVRRAELAFYADDRIAVPAAVRVQRWDGARWIELTRAPVRAVANGITDVALPSVTAARYRLVMRSSDDRPMRLIEMKLF